MRHYYEALRIIKKTLEAHPTVNTVTHGDISDIDLDKKNIYPLCHIAPNNAVPTEQTMTINFTVFVMLIRDINKKPRVQKFEGNDNEIDNLNEALAICNYLFKSIAKLGDEFTILNTPLCEPFTESRKNLLDGWAMTFDLEMPNDEISVC